MNFNYFHRKVKQDEMLVKLFLNSLLASAGFFTMGILISWPATALPSIRKISYSMLKTKFDTPGGLKTMH